jgi:sulfide:quinone oxidoreductase
VGRTEDRLRCGAEHVAMPPDRRLRVLVAGGGVAGLEALLALHDLAGDRVELTLLSPAQDFVYRPLSVAEPFSAGHAQRVPLSDIVRDVDALLVRSAVAQVDAAERTVITTDADRLVYDELILAVGARTEPALERAITWSPDADPAVFGALLRDIDEGYSKRIAFVIPPDVAWPVPGYELALMTAHQARAMGHDDVEVLIVTAEEAPLAIFGTHASYAVAAELREAGVQTRTGSHAVGPDGLAVDRVIALPRAVGPALTGVPADARGFIPVDEHGRVEAVDHVWAAGDGTTFPVKQGGLATQQADAVAESVAARAGAHVVPKPFRPVLRGILLTGGGVERWMRHDMAGGARDGMTATHTLWWPPTKIAGRYLSPYLAALDESASLGKHRRPDGLPVELDLERELAVLRDTEDRARFALRRAEDDAAAELRALERDGEIFSRRAAEAEDLLAKRGYLHRPHGH